MTLTAGVGQAQALEGREAAAQATHRALDQIGRNQAVFGIVIASRYHAIQQVLTGASTLLGDIPLLGLSTNAEITEDGQSQRSVVVALLAGDGISVKADWWGGFGEDSRGVAQRMTQTLQLYHSDGTLLVVTVDDPAWATQLKFLESTLRRRLAEVAGATVERIEVRVSRGPR